MKRTSWQSVYFAAAMLVFMSLLITGGSRLIATPESEAREYTAHVHAEASLICPPESVRESLVTGRQDEKFSADGAVACSECREIRRPLLTDANGNIVTYRSYIHAVYQAFALGDGFV